jgi:hypothetical protein
MAIHAGWRDLQEFEDEEDARYAIGPGAIGLTGIGAWSTANIATAPGYMPSSTSNSIQHGADQSHPERQYVGYNTELNLQAVRASPSPVVPYALTSSLAQQAQSAGLKFGDVFTKFNDVLYPKSDRHSYGDVHAAFRHNVCLASTDSTKSTRLMAVTESLEEAPCPIWPSHARKSV